MLKYILKQIFPKVDPEVQAVIDRKSLENICRICLVMFGFELTALWIFISTRDAYDEPFWTSIRSVTFCLFACLAGGIIAGAATRREKISHAFAASFNGTYYLVFSLWTVDVSLRNYNKGEQMLTFFAVQILMVCFVSLKPIYGIVYPTVIYVILYIALNVYSSGKGLNAFNYALLMVVTVTGMLVRFYSEKVSSDNAVKLGKSYDKLFYNNRHDGLTGLRNRRALEEDVQKITKDHVNVYMIDINYFKKINDNYGHAVGDAVLKETARWIRSVFSEDRCYRYGGDEFLILSVDKKSYVEDTFSFTSPEITDRKILLSIGHAQGDPKGHDELFELISEADKKLYEVKARTHATGK
ncbi:MAG: GGDEF domain-containing protein [Lachnospiraceae bacterium]|nr:GGDEF domain-containing protein [Lachnospiraceae bacterium]